ncbi:hypothetical protein BESB_034410 [Besnoitia besnoiti]|uniref:AP2 domain transcription factor AP2X-11 n=1 Tax=Besnoitia besnoiti TaxID=94643 RepID=A0A2A9MMG2_BESBE|nr:hypothetical protein BESB_034410 [Besnoitia besnoiti]PFH36983.1 hypothetical protein BESB_034410 [Besnoitia besnoiti]
MASQISGVGLVEGGRAMHLPHAKLGTDDACRAAGREGQAPAAAPVAPHAAAELQSSVPCDESRVAARPSTRETSSTPSSTSTTEAEGSEELLPSAKSPADSPQSLETHEATASPGVGGPSESSLLTGHLVNVRSCQMPDDARSCGADSQAATSPLSDPPFEADSAKALPATAREETGGGPASSSEETSANLQGWPSPSSLLTHSLSLPQPVFATAPSLAALESAETTPTSSVSPSSVSQIANLSRSSLLLLGSLTPHQQLAALVGAASGGACAAHLGSAGGGTSPKGLAIDWQAVLAGASADDASAACSPLRRSSCLSSRTYTRASSTISLSPESTVKRRKTSTGEVCDADGAAPPSSLPSPLSAAAPQNSLLSMFASSLASTSPLHFATPPPPALGATRADAAGNSLGCHVATLSPSLLSCLSSSLAASASPAAPTVTAADLLSAALQQRQLETAALLSYAASSCSLSPALSADLASLPASAWLRAQRSPPAAASPVSAAAATAPKAPACRASESAAGSQEPGADVEAALALLQQNPHLLAELSRLSSPAAPPKDAAGRGALLEAQTPPESSREGAAQQADAAAPDEQQPADREIYVHRVRRSPEGAKPDDKVRLRALSKGVPVPSAASPGATLGEDFAARARQCEHVPGVCFDRWNQGWIATWREHRRPVHKHFSAKKYGFEEARALAIEHRQLMVAKQQEQQAAAQTEFSTSLSASVDALTPQRRGCKSPDGSGAAATLTGSYESARVGQSRLQGEKAPGARGDLAANASLETPRKNRPAGGAAPRDASVPSGAVAERLSGAGGEKAGGGELSWSQLVARMPRVERVSFDFTNQSWIAQWKQQGCTTYRRFSVSKFGFYGAHRLAVEFKQQNYHPVASQKPAASAESLAALSSTSPLTARSTRTADDRLASSRTPSLARRQNLAKGRRAGAPGELVQGVIPVRSEEVAMNAAAGVLRGPLASELPSVPRRGIAEGKTGTKTETNPFSPSCGAFPVPLAGLSPSAYAQVLSGSFLSDAAAAVRSPLQQRQLASRDGADPDQPVEAGSTQASSGADSPIVADLHPGGSKNSAVVPPPSVNEAAACMASGPNVHSETPSPVQSSSLPLSTWHSARQASPLGRHPETPAGADCEVDAEPRDSPAPLSSFAHLPASLASLLSSSTLPACLPASVTPTTRRGRASPSPASRASQKRPREAREQEARHALESPAALTRGLAASFASAVCPGGPTPGLASRGKPTAAGESAGRVVSSSMTTAPHEDDASGSNAWLGLPTPFAATPGDPALAHASRWPSLASQCVSGAASFPSESQAASVPAPQEGDDAAAALRLYKIAVYCMLTDLKTNCLGTVFASLPHTGEKEAASLIQPSVELLDHHIQRVTGATGLEQVAAYGNIFFGCLKASSLPSSYSGSEQAAFLTALAKMEGGPADAGAQAGVPEVQLGGRAAQDQTEAQRREEACVAI